MADWTDPTTWRDIKKFDAALRELSKRLAAADSATPELLGDLLEVIGGHQKSVSDMSFVVGKLVTYTTAAHEERRHEVDAIHDLVKTLKKLNKAVVKLTKRVDRIEARSAKVRR